MEQGVETLALTRNRMKGTKNFFTCDGASKGLHAVIKMIAFWFLDRVITLLLDSDAAVGDIVNTAESTDVALKKIGPLSDEGQPTKEVACGLSTDSGAVQRKV